MSSAVDLRLEKLVEIFSRFLCQGERSGSSSHDVDVVFMNFLSMARFSYFLYFLYILIGRSEV